MLPALPEPGARRNGINDGFGRWHQCLCRSSLQPAEGKTDLCARINEYYTNSLINLKEKQPPEGRLILKMVSTFFPGQKLPRFLLPGVFFGVSNCSHIAIL
jgi:hypothetical protein